MRFKDNAETKTIETEYGTLEYGISVEYTDHNDELGYTCEFNFKEPLIINGESIRVNGYSAQWPKCEYTRIRGLPEKMPEHDNHDDWNEQMKADKEAWDAADALVTPLVEPIFARIWEEAKADTDGRKAKEIAAVAEALQLAKNRIDFYATETSKEQEFILRIQPKLDAMTA